MAGFLLFEITVLGLGV